LLVLALSVSGVAAQDATATPEATAAATNTLKDVLTKDGRFTTFLAAMDGAGLSGILTGSTPFTIFAPTDDAFTAAMGLLGMTSDDMMSDANHATLVKILGAHIVGGKHLYTQLSRGTTLHTLAGTRITTSLVKVARSSRVVYLNGGSSSISVDGGGTDLIASNGLVDVVDAVLLPDGLGLPTAYVRVAHFSPDAGSADVWVNGAAAATAVDFKTVGDWMEVTVGNYSVAIVPAGGKLADNVAMSTVSLSAGTHTTVAVIGTSANGSITLAPITEDFSATEAGKVHATFFHAVEGGPGANIVVDGSTLIENLMFPGSNADGSNDGVFSTLLNVGSKAIKVVDTTTPATTLASTTLNAETGHSYLVAVVGSADAPEIVVADTAPEAPSS
jgi:uncharacterized surface protein with fasciclin (FAS1) repeats